MERASCNPKKINICTPTKCSQCTAAQAKPGHHCKQRQPQALVCGMHWPTQPRAACIGRHNHTTPHHTTPHHTTPHHTTPHHTTPHHTTPHHTTPHHTTPHHTTPHHTTPHHTTPHHTTPHNLTWNESQKMQLRHLVFEFPFPLPPAPPPPPPAPGFSSRYCLIFSKRSTNSLHLLFSIVFFFATYQSCTGRRDITIC